eukprot:scaffold382_cov380-Prasinococcus_capsulatus_cf.AAC.43
MLPLTVALDNALPQVKHEMLVARRSIEDEFQRARDVCASYLMELEDALREEQRDRQLGVSVKDEDPQAGGVVGGVSSGTSSAETEEMEMENEDAKGVRGLPSKSVEVRQCTAMLA